MARTRRWVAVGLVVALAGVVPAAARAEEGGSAPLVDDPTMIALAVALACADAPQTVGVVAPAAREPASAGPELELVATVRAKTLQFDEVPRVDVVFHGSGQRKTTWKTERVNLPAKPEPGVVYRDVVVRLTISSDLEELTSLLRQAKRASAGVRIEGDAAPVVPAAASRPIEIAPPAFPAAPTPPAPAAAPAPAPALPPAPPPAPATSGPAAASAPTAPAAAASPPLLAPAPQPVVAPSPAPAAPPAPPVPATAAPPAAAFPAPPVPAR